MGENEESYSEIHTITNERQLFDAQFNSVEQIGEIQGNLYLLDKALNFLRMGMQFIGVIIAVKKSPVGRKMSSAQQKAIRLRENDGCKRPGPREGLP